MSVLNPPPHVAGLRSRRIGMVIPVPRLRTWNTETCFGVLGDAALSCTASVVIGVRQLSRQTHNQSRGELLPSPPMLSIHACFGSVTTDPRVVAMTIALSLYPS